MKSVSRWRIRKTVNLGLFCFFDIIFDTLARLSFLTALLKIIT